MQDISLLANQTALRCDHIRFATEGTKLVGRLYVPAGTPRAVVVLHGAIGVPQRSYRHFAAWLAAVRGLACLTYDYRDFGLSATRPLRQSRATLADWGIADQEAAMNAAQARFPGVPLWVIGHSLGGAMLPFHRPRDIERAIVLTAGLVHVSDHPWPYQALARQFWHVSGPLATYAAGYMPGRHIGFGSDLPAGVFWQWRRWCLRRGFHVNEAGTLLPPLDRGNYRVPTRLVAVEDDVMVPARAVWRMLDLIPEAMTFQKLLRPAEFGLMSIGHFGAFRPENAVLWPAILD